MPCVLHSVVHGHEPLRTIKCQKQLFISWAMMGWLAKGLHQSWWWTFAFAAEAAFYLQVPRELCCITASALSSAGCHSSLGDRCAESLCWQIAFPVL